MSAALNRASKELSVSHNLLHTTYLPPTPTRPYTHACPTATGSLFSAYMHI